MDYLLTAYQKLYSALSQLERFSRENDLYDNISCIDSFLSEYRSITFVLQNELAHTDFKDAYDELRTKYLNGEDCKWLKDKRNETQKEHPLTLKKEISLVGYFIDGSRVLCSELFTAADELEYQSLVKAIQTFISKIPTLEVYFSVEFIYKESDKEENIFTHVKKGIKNMKLFLEQIDKQINGNKSKERINIEKKIRNLTFMSVPNDLWFVEDYVYYKEGAIFERREGLELGDGSRARLSMTASLSNFHVQQSNNPIADAFKFFVILHEFCFGQQKQLMPTFFILYSDYTYEIDSYVSTVKTTTYRKIHNYARKIKNGEDIKAVFFVTETLNYSSIQAFRMDYIHRKKLKSREALLFVNIQKDSVDAYTVDSHMVINEFDGGGFAKITKEQMDLLFMKPIADAFKAN